MTKILTDEEVRKVKKSMITVSIGNVGQMIKNGGIKPIFLDNGYAASLSLDVIRENLRIIHLSVSNTKGKTDIETAISIAYDIIGKDCQMVRSMNVKNIIHFMKIEGENTMVELMKDIR